MSKAWSCPNSLSGLARGAGLGLALFLALGAAAGAAAQTSGPGGPGSLAAPGPAPDPDPDPPRDPEPPREPPRTPPPEPPRVPPPPPPPPPGGGGGGGGTPTDSPDPQRDPAPEGPGPVGGTPAPSPQAGSDAPRASRSDPAPPRAVSVRRGEISRARDGRLEYITSGPVAESGDAAAALNALGAQITRLRDYPALERRALVAVFPRGLSLEEARDAVSAAAPATEIDVHALYGFAQGRPRLYAPELIGDGAPGVCRVLRAVPVGVIDGPVDGAHPALRGATVSAETVLEAGTRRPDPRHGTAVAALIAGEDPGGALAGFARGVSVHAVDAFRIHRGNPRADVEHVAAALDVLAARGVRLVNMSFAGPPNRALGDILRRADARGLVMIAAAGNAGSSRAAYPAAAPEVIAVTAVDARGRRYREANTGAHIEFAAPGVDLYTAGGGSGGSYASGTSYAAPIVTALAARLAARERISPETLRAALRARALDLGADGRDAEFGWGLVRAGGC